MPVMYQNWIERSDLQRNARSDRYYLFGDNLRRVGMGGQAKSMRGEPNAIGIATKNGPSMHINDMWVERTPADAKRFISLLEADLEQAEDLLEAIKRLLFRPMVLEPVSVNFQRMHLSPMNG